MKSEERSSETKGLPPTPGMSKTFSRAAKWASRCGSVSLDALQIPDKSCLAKQVPLTPRQQQNSKVRMSLPTLQPLSIAKRNLQEWPKAGSDDIGEWPNPPTPRQPNDTENTKSTGDCNSGYVKPLFYSEPVDLQLKRNKLAYFDKECSRVAEHIYLGSDAVAKNRDVLLKNGITHVLNCVGFVCPEYFKSDFIYKTLWLQDSPCEDITSILYDVFDYFEEVREQNGRVFVHCCQGVSRSTSLVIAYLMWREGQMFEDAFQYVKAARGITNPNMGFASQLLQCQKRVLAAPMSPTSLLRMYRMAPHSSYAPLHLVPKMLSNPSIEALDSRGAFILHSPSAIYVWIGHNCEVMMENMAKAAASQLIRYERLQSPVSVVREGEETDAFWGIFCKSSMDDIAKCGKAKGLDGNPLESSHSEKSQVVAVRTSGIGNKRVDEYDDYELFRRALTGGVVPPFSISNSGIETRLPARESGWGILRRQFACGIMKNLISTECSSNKTEQAVDGHMLSSQSACASPLSSFLGTSAGSKSPSISPSSLSFTPSPGASSFSSYSSPGSPLLDPDLHESHFEYEESDKFLSKSLLSSGRRRGSFPILDVSSSSLSKSQSVISPKTESQPSIFFNPAKIGEKAQDFDRITENFSLKQKHPNPLEKQFSQKSQDNSVEKVCSTP